MNEKEMVILKMLDGATLKKIFWPQGSFVFRLHLGTVLIIVGCKRGLVIKLTFWQEIVRTLGLSEVETEKIILEVMNREFGWNYKRVFVGLRPIKPIKQVPF